ncbi:MAG: MoxR family ATPase [Deltaproteobacteria bacterium]|nr:MoxR family ATPase [Deltaproteobacteria bacterium]
MDYSEAYKKIKILQETLGLVIKGKPEVIGLAVTTLFAKGHLLIEDVPGVGKTTLAHAMARSINCTFQRIQFTSDLLPSDCIGVTVYNGAKHEFEFRKGPIFANIVLADEINRSTPKTQSALLEAMNDRQVSVDKTTYQLPEPFMLLATQNPLEFAGTFPLPESQLDRFTICIKMGYPSMTDEKKIIRQASSASVMKELKPVLSAGEVLDIQGLVEKVRVEEDLLNYIITIAEGTRRHRAIRLGVSPRGTMTLYRAAQAFALASGRDYCTPDDVKGLVTPVFAHRIIPAASLVGEEVNEARALLEEILSGITVPI